MLSGIKKYEGLAGNFERRMDALDDKKIKLISRSEGLKSFLQQALSHLELKTNNGDAECVAHFLMGKIDKLPDGLAPKQRPIIDDEVKRELFSVLRTHRYEGIFGTVEGSEKTIAKLQKLNEIIQKFEQSEKLVKENIRQEEIRHADNSISDNSPASQTAAVKFTQQEIGDWLFNGKRSTAVAGLPDSILSFRGAHYFAPNTDISAVPMLGNGKFASRIGIHEGRITDLKAGNGDNVAITCPNGGDLFFGLGFNVETGVIYAAGPGLQTDLYNQYGVPEREGVTALGKEKYAQTEGRGYALTCDAHDMKESHGIGTVELLVVPERNKAGVVNMYYQALVHSRDKTHIIFPMAGFTRPVINYNCSVSAELTLAAIDKFQKNFPDSNLKIIIAIYDDSYSVGEYKKAIENADRN